MAAGLGFKTFTTGEVLTAADTNGYLMQGVLVFASAAARDAAITSPQEGQFAYLKDTNVTTYYTGSAWTNLDTTGMTNPMTTTGDMVYSSSGSTPARLGIGTTGQVLSVAGGIPSWATPASGALAFVNATTFTSVTSVSLPTSTFGTTYQNYRVMILFTNASANAAITVRKRSSGTDSTGATYTTGGATFPSSGAVGQVQSSGGTSWATGITVNIPYGVYMILDVVSPGTATNYNQISVTGNIGGNGLSLGWINSAGGTYDSLSFIMASGNFTGNIYVYGYSNS
jgi:hypothetical protein